MAPRYDDPLGFPLADGPPQPARIRLRRKKKRIHVRPHSSIKTGATRSEINVTPLVDVVLVLLIIFMVVAPMLHRGVEIKLPETAHHDQLQDTGEQVIVSVRDDGVYIDQERVGDTPTVGKDGKAIEVSATEALIARVRKELHDGARPAFVRADKRLKYGQVRYVLQQIHNAGASMVSMQTEEHK